MDYGVVTGLIASAGGVIVFVIARVAERIAGER